MSDTRSVVGENLDDIFSYSEDTWQRIYKYAAKSDTTYSEKRTRRAMIDLMIKMGFTSRMPAHGSSKPGRGKKLNHATQVYLQTVADKLTEWNIP